MWASTPTNVVRIRIGASVFVGLCRRADRVVRPYGCILFRIGTIRFAILYRTGGVEPHPYANVENLTNFPKSCDFAGVFCGYAEASMLLFQLFLNAFSQLKNTVDPQHDINRHDDVERHIRIAAVA